MQKDTVRTLGQIKNLMEQQNQYKRYMKVAEATRNYQLDRRIITKIGGGVKTAIYMVRQ